MAMFLSVSVSAKETIQYQQFDDDIQIIDVRTLEEWKGGHHPNALHVPHTTILDGNGFENLQKDKPVMLYCTSGKRAEQAKNYLEKQDFRMVKNLGGISDLIIPKKGNE
ncbi:MAG: phage shock protein E [Alphaproteobacteria bacterium]|jgi:phage shock protein E